MSGSGRFRRWSGAREEEEGKEDEEEVGENRIEAEEAEAEREVEEGSVASIPSRCVKLAELDSKSESLIMIREEKGRVSEKNE